MSEIEAKTLGAATVLCVKSRHGVFQFTHEKGPLPGQRWGQTRATVLAVKSLSGWLSSYP